MDRYYDEILEKIEDLMRKEAYEECLKLLEEELSMPYIPSAYEAGMINSYNECRSILRSHHPVRSYDEDDIEALLKGSLDEQFLAVEQLKKCNIRQYLAIIQAYFRDKPHYLVQCYLIETLMEQNITDELTIDKNGLEITFAPCFIEAPMDSDGIRQAIMLLREWFENEDPTFTMMCVESLVKEAYLMLPFNVEEDEAFELATAIACYVFLAGDDEQAMKQFLDKHGLTNLKDYQLLLNTYEM